MIECSKCGAKYPTERMFCGKCKERLGVRCPICGFINLLDDLFCGICLTELSAQIELNAQMGIPAGQKSEEPVSSESPLYEEIRVGAEEDESFAVADEKIAQEEINEIFQEDEE